MKGERFPRTPESAKLPRGSDPFFSSLLTPSKPYRDAVRHVAAQVFVAKQGRRVPGAEDFRGFLRGPRYFLGDLPCALPRVGQFFKFFFQKSLGPVQLVHVYVPRWSA